jgi:hypothetical protein
VPVTPTVAIRSFPATTYAVPHGLVAHRTTSREQEKITMTPTARDARRNARRRRLRTAVLLGLATDPAPVPRTITAAVRATR